MRVDMEIRLRDLVSGMLPKMRQNSRNVFEGIDRDISKTQKHFNDLGKPVKLRVDTSELQKAGSIMNNFSGQMGFLKTTGAMALGNMVGGGISQMLSGVKQEVKNVFNAGLEGSATKAQFGVLGGGQQGRNLFDQLTKYIQDTPFGTELYKQGTGMMANGIKAKDVLSDMRMMADVSMGDGGKMAGLTYAWSQTNSAGKLTGQDLLQYINAGFNPLQEISGRTGKSMNLLRKEMEAGKITVDQVRQSFMWATGAGGKFHGMMDMMMKTPKGKLDAMMGNIDAARMQLGTNLLPAFDRLIDRVNTDVISKLPGWMDRATPYFERGINSFEASMPNMEEFGKSLLETLKPAYNFFTSDEATKLRNSLLDLGTAITKDFSPAAKELARGATWLAGKLGENVNNVGKAVNFVGGAQSLLGRVRPFFREDGADTTATGLMNTVNMMAGFRNDISALTFGLIKPAQQGRKSAMNTDQPQRSFAGMKPWRSPLLDPPTPKNHNTSGAQEVSDSIIRGGQKVINIHFRNFTENFSIKNEGVNAFDKSGEQTQEYFTQMLSRVLKSVADSVYGD